MLVHRCWFFGTETISQQVHLFEGFLSPLRATKMDVDELARCGSILRCVFHDQKSPRDKREAWEGSCDERSDKRIFFSCGRTRKDTIWEVTEW